jgi:hypothetical protein
MLVTIGTIGVLLETPSDKSRLKPRGYVGRDEVQLDFVELELDGAV